MHVDAQHSCVEERRKFCSKLGPVFVHSVEEEHLVFVRRRDARMINDEQSDKQDCAEDGGEPLGVGGKPSNDSEAKRRKEVGDVMVVDQCAADSRKRVFFVTSWWERLFRWGAGH